MKKKQVVVTGSTAGLGFATVKSLAEKGMHIIMLGRNNEKGQKSRAKIQAQIPAASLDWIQADLSKQEDIRRAAAQILDKYAAIDTLINNAGTWFSQRKITEDGVETVFAVNHLSYFLLTHLLYPALKKADDARIINIGSDSHFQAKMNFEDLSLEKSYHGLKSYAQSKLANTLFTYELDRLKKENHVSVYCVQPGLVKTDIGLKHTKWLHQIAWKLRRSGGVTPEEGAQTQIYLASSNEVGDKSGLYWDKGRPKPSSKASYNEVDAQKLWEMSMDMCQINDYFPN